MAAVSGTAAYAISRGELVAPNEFPVRYHGSAQKAYGATFMVFIALFATILTVWAGYDVFS
ncbi:hypothetical protein [Dactylosporangium darangshiense]|uniref:Uncharacterized protein n=1 Tax=Dactylosporangium darangshiense TaxID=579108 RepID=A0ABP8DIN3_9ACTN